jgi:hypothetical protein
MSNVRQGLLSLLSPSKRTKHALDFLTQTGSRKMLAFLRRPARSGSSESHDACCVCPHLDVISAHWKFGWRNDHPRDLHVAFPCTGESYSYPGVRERPFVDLSTRARVYGQEFSHHFSVALLGYSYSLTFIFILYTSQSARFSHIYSILPHTSILYIIIYPLYPLCDPLVTLSKYIHVWSSFEGFIETNLMVQSKFNLDFWFVSYSIFFLCLASRARHCPL